MSLQIITAKLELAMGAGTNYFAVFGKDEFTETRSQHAWPVAGVFRNLRVTLSQTPSAASTIVFTLRINESASAMAVTLNPGDLTGTYIATDIAIAAGDRVVMQTVNSGTGGGTPWWSFEFEPTTGSHSCYGCTIQNGFGITPIYLGALFTVYNNVSADPVTAVIPIPGVITDFTACLDGAPGAGNAVFTLWKNGIKQDGTGGTIDTRIPMGTVRTASSAFSLSVAEGDTLYATYERTGGSPINVYGGITLAFQPLSAGLFIYAGHAEAQLSATSGHYYPAVGSFFLAGGGVTGQSSLAGISTTGASNLRVWLSTAPGGGKSYRLRYTLDESTTPPAGGPDVTISGSDTTGTDSIGVVGVFDTHFLTMRIDGSGTPTAAYCAWSAAVSVGGVEPPDAGSPGGSPGEDVPPPTEVPIEDQAGTFIDRWFSDLDDQAPGNYYGGFKEARILTAGSGERRLSHPTTGEWTGSTFPMSLSDTDRFFRQALAGFTDRYILDGAQQVWMTTRQNRAELGTAYTVFVGLMTLRMTAQLAVDVELTDIVSQSILSDQGQVPWRIIGDGMLDQLITISDSLDRETPEPIIYGSHIRIPPLPGSPGDAASPQGFVVSPTYLGVIDVAAVAYHVWLVAGHAVSDIPFWRIDDAATASEGADWLVPTHPGWVAAFGAPYVDYRSPVYGTTRRYTLILGVSGNADPDACADGTKQLTVGVVGVEDEGNGTGTVITDRIQQYKHFLINFVARHGGRGYQSGHWLTNPTWDLFDAPVSIVDADSFDACSAIGVIRLPGVGSPSDAGYLGAAVIGAKAGDRQSVRHWIAEWNRSCGVRFGITHFGQFRVTMLHPTAAVKAAAPLYTDVSETLKETFGTDIGWADQANRIPFKADYDHANGVWTLNDSAIADASVANYGRMIDGEAREYLFAPGITMAFHLAHIESLMFAEPPRVITFACTVGPDGVDDSLGYRDLGDYVRFRHFDAVSNTFSEVRLGQVVRHQVDAGGRRVLVDVLDCEDLIGFDLAPEFPSIGSPLNEACSSAIDMGDLSTVYDQTFDTTLNGTDESVSGSPSFAGTEGPGIAYHAAWFKMTGNIFDGVATFSTLGSEYDTQIAVYSGSCGALVQQGYNDNFGILQTSALDVDIVGGTDYFILVSGYGPADGGFLHFRATTDRSTSQYGPQASITCPMGAVPIAAGSTTASRQTLITANPGASFCLAAGVHVATGTNTPTSNQKFYGEYGAVLDGSSWTRPESDVDAAPFQAIANGVTGVEIHNLVIRDMPSYAINAYLVSGWVIDHCEIASCRTGLCVGDDAVVTNNSIHDCVGNPGDADPSLRGGGYAISQTDNVLFDANEVYSNGTEQKFIGGTAGTDNTNYTVTHNYFHDNAGNGFWSDGYGAGGVVQHNVSNHNGANGIVIEKGKSVTVDQNTCNDNGELGVSFQSTRDSFITNNILTNNVSGIEFFVDLDDVGTNGWSIDLRDNVATGNTVTVPNDPGTSFAVTLGHVGSGSFTDYTSNTKNNDCDSNEYFVHSSGGNWWLWSSAIGWTAWQALPQDAAGTRTVI